MANKFWMVLVDGTFGCSYRHPSLESARREAERLLRLPSNQEKGVTILEAMEYGRIKYPPVAWEAIPYGMYQGEEIKEG